MLFFFFLVNAYRIKKIPEQIELLTMVVLFCASLLAKQIALIHNCILQRSPLCLRICRFEMSYKFHSLSLVHMYKINLQKPLICILGPDRFLYFMTQEHFPVTSLACFSEILSSFCLIILTFWAVKWIWPRGIHQKSTFCKV